MPCASAPMSTPPPTTASCDREMVSNESLFMLLDFCSQHAVTARQWIPPLADRALSTASGAMSPRRGSPSSMKAFLGVVVAVVAVAGCGSDPCDPNAEACTYEADVSTQTIAGGVED